MSKPTDTELQDYQDYADAYMGTGRYAMWRQPSFWLPILLVGLLLGSIVLWA